MSDTIDDGIEAAPGAFSRRKLLIGGGIGALAVVAAACGSDDSTSGASGRSTSSTAAGGRGGSAAGDAKVATIAAGLEVLAVSTYQAALDAATAGHLGAVPPAVGAFVGSALKEHQAALERWNGILTGAGAEAVDKPPADLKATVDGELAKVTDAAGAAKLALSLEQTAADTYLSAVPTLKDEGAITLAGALQCAGQDHQAVLHYVLGEYPVPEAFQGTSKAYPG